MATSDAECKWVSGIPGQLNSALVDGFMVKKSGCQHKFLTHFHGDHTTGLYKSFNEGIIYCSEVTRNLVISEIGVEPKRVVALPLERGRVIETLGLKVTLIDANHCPGAVVILFESMRPHAAFLGVHTGDFRAGSQLITKIQSAVSATRAAKIDKLWLDTTYALPPDKWRLPPMGDTLDAVKRVCLQELERDKNTVFVIGMYTIGKERVLNAVVEATGIKATPCNSKRYNLLSLCGYGSILSPKGVMTNVIAAPLNDLKPQELGSIYKGSNIVGFRCTGWGLRKIDMPPPTTTSVQHQAAWKLPTPASYRHGNAVVYTIPYSEHSSFDELCSFTSTVKPSLIISTVGGEEARLAAVRAVTQSRYTQQNIQSLFASKKPVPVSACTTVQPAVSPGARKQTEVKGFHTLFSAPKRQKSNFAQPEVIDIDSLESEPEEVVDLT